VSLATPSISGAMSVDDRVRYEGRTRPRQAVLAAVAAVLLMAGAIVQLSGLHTKVDELTLDLIVANKRVTLDIIAAVLNGFGSLALGATLAYLFGAARARNPQAQPIARILALAGGALAAAAGIAYAVAIGIKAHQFVTSGNQTYVEANHLTSSSGILVLQLLGQASALLLAIAFVLVSLNALRVGLLTRFMGYLGMFAGALVLFQITQVPVVQAYWLLALAYLMSGRWPTGVPPAWQTGRAEKWPSSQELREQRIRAQGAARRGKQKPEPEPEPVAAAAPPAPNPRAAGKRKRKRRK